MDKIIFFDNNAMEKFFMSACVKSNFFMPSELK